MIHIRNSSEKLRIEQVHSNSSNNSVRNENITGTGAMKAYLIIHLHYLKGKLERCDYTDATHKVFVTAALFCLVTYHSATAF